MAEAHPPRDSSQARLSHEYQRICPGASPGRWHLTEGVALEALLSQLRDVPDGAGEKAFGGAVIRAADGTGRAGGDGS
jgi:hypothetical protein